MRLPVRFTSWLRRARRLIHRSGVENEMGEEFQFHIDSYAADLARTGLSPEEARRRAYAEFGGVEARKVDCRDALGLRLFDELRGDLRYAWRQLRRSPGFTTMAVLSLALGLGANTAIFSVMETALWKSMPVQEPQQLRLFSWVSGPRLVMNATWGNWTRVTRENERLGASFSYAAFATFQRAAPVFSSVFAFKPIGRVTVMADDQAELVNAHLVSGEFYAGVGVVPIAGRPILPSDDRRGGAETVALISDGFWARRFGRDPSIIGRQLRVNQVPVTIVGVNPPGFTGVQVDQAPDLFMPLTAQPAVLPRRHTPNGSLLDNPDYWWLLVMGRLKPGVTDAQAEQASQLALQQVVRTTLPPDRAGRDQPHMRLLSGARGLDNLKEDFARPLVVLLSLVSVVLLIACANVANLLLARASARRREISLRLALGAGRLRLARQLLTEGLALGLAGGALGLLLAWWTRDAIPRLMLPSWSSDQFSAAFDLRVLALTAAVTIATSVLFSLAPIAHAWRVDVPSSLKDGGRSIGHPGQAARGRALVITQVCLSVLILIGAGLFLRTLSNLRSVALGFNPERVLLFTIDPPRTRYAEATRTALFEEIDRRIAGIPGVESSSASASALVAGGSSTSSVRVDGRAEDTARRAWVNDVGHRFFETMTIPIVQGRSFDARDRRGSPAVAVVNQRFAREHFPNGNPVGQILRNDDRTFEIVGVCGDTHFDRARTPVPPTFYRLYTQSPDAGTMTFEVRTAVSLSAIVPQIREAVRAIDKDLPVFDIRTQTQQIDATLSSERLFVALTSAFGGLALILASVGLYGILAQNVSRRTSEIGLRLALGAARRDVLVMVLREASVLALIGVALGTAAAVIAGRSIESMLFGVTPLDPLAIGGAIVIMMLMAALAGWLPARRASRLDPMVALRHE